MEFTKEELENEEWRDIPSWIGYYQVSNLGRVKSLERKVPHKYSKEITIYSKILKQGIGTTGYYAVSLYKNKIGYTRKVHQLVVIAFLGFDRNNRNGMVVNHIDGDPLNNRVYNLELVSQRENTIKGRRSNMSDKKTSKYTGVSFFKRDNKFRSAIEIKGNNVYLGSSKCELEAYNMYKAALKNLHLYNGDNSEFRRIIGIY